MKKDQLIERISLVEDHGNNITYNPSDPANIHHVDKFLVRVKDIGQCFVQKIVSNLKVIKSNMKDNRCVEKNFLRLI